MPRTVNGTGHMRLFAKVRMLCRKAWSARVSLGFAFVFILLAERSAAREGAQRVVRIQDSRAMKAFVLARLYDFQFRAHDGSVCASNKR